MDKLYLKSQSQDDAFFPDAGDANFALRPLALNITNHATPRTRDKAFGNFGLVLVVLLADDGLHVGHLRRDRAGWQQQKDRSDHR